MGIKTKPYQGTTTESNEIKVKREAKEILNKLIWEWSHFENATAICNHDFSKLTTNRSRIRDAIKLFLATFQKLSILKKTRNLLLEKKSGSHVSHCTPLQMQ